MYNLKIDSSFFECNLNQVSEYHLTKLINQVKNMKDREVARRFLSDFPMLKDTVGTKDYFKFSEVRKIAKQLPIKITVEQMKKEEKKTFKKEKEPKQFNHKANNIEGNTDNKKKRSFEK